MARSLTIPQTSGEEWRAYWVLVLIATLGCVLSSCAGYILGVTLLPIEKEFGWTRAQISSGPMLVSFTAIILSTAAGYMIDRVGARRVAIVVVISMTSSIALMGTMTNNYWQWWLLWGVYGIASAATSTVWMAPLTTLFVKGRGLALAFATMGTSLSSAVMPPLTDYFVESGDWRRAFLFIGLAQAVILLPLVLLFFRGAEEFAAARMAADETAANPAILPGMTVREGFTSVAFYKILAAFTIGLIGVAGIIINIVPVLISHGIASRQAALIAGSYGLASIAGRFLGGWALDRLGPKWLTVVPTLMILLMPVGLLAGKGSVSIAYTVAICTAFLSGAKFPAFIYLVSTYFGGRSFGTLFGTMSIGGAVAGGLGPMLVNSIYDVTRSYDLALWITIPSLLIAAGLYASLGRPPDFTIADPDKERAAPA